MRRGLEEIWLAVAGAGQGGQLSAGDSDSQGVGDDETDEVIQEMELMDDLIEHEEGEPILSFLKHPEKLPRPEELSEKKAEEAVKCALVELAMFGVALHVCEHFTWRDTYRLLVDEILPKQRAFTELAGTGWVQNFMTSEYCPKCDAEADARFEAQKEP